ncbi:hypothetical protein EZS27_021562, partial [termite gut metagenome]
LQQFISTNNMHLFRQPNENEFISAFIEIVDLLLQFNGVQRNAKS